MTDIDKISKVSELRENLLNEIMANNDIFPVKKNPINFLVFGREWNSWYPSLLNVQGGCYFFNINEEIVIIDPGFGTLQLIKNNNLDLRQIHHVFVTHYHPDHCEQLIKILTALQKLKLNIYLNPTSYSQFIIFKSENINMVKIEPNTEFKLKFQKENPKYSIKCKIIESFHREIGGFRDAIGLKFSVQRNADHKMNKIGFVSDTDGLDIHIEHYFQNYDDCDILVLHLGSIHKPIKECKHLYLKGTEDLLNKLTSNKLIIISEFGLELADSKFYYRALNQSLPQHMKFLDLMKEYYELKDEEYNTETDDYSEKLNTLSKIIEFSFNKLLEDVWDHKLYIPLSYELILPFFNSDFCNITTIKEFLKNENNKIISYELIDKIHNLQNRIYQDFVFLQETIGKDNFFDFKPIQEKFPHINFLIFKENLKKIFSYFDKISLDKLIKGIRIGLLDNSDRMRAFHNFGYHVDHNRKYSWMFDNSFENMKFRSFLGSYQLNIVLYGFFLQNLIKIRDSIQDETIIHPREDVCKYLISQTNKSILPGLPTYQILFTDENSPNFYVIKCDCPHFYDSYHAFPLHAEDWNLARDPKNQEVKLISNISQESLGCTNCSINFRFSNLSSSKVENSQFSFIPIPKNVSLCEFLKEYDIDHVSPEDLKARINDLEFQQKKDMIKVLCQNVETNPIYASTTSWKAFLEGLLYDSETIIEKLKIIGEIFKGITEIKRFDIICTNPNFILLHDHIQYLLYKAAKNWGSFRLAYSSDLDFRKNLLDIQKFISKIEGWEFISTFIQRINWIRDIPLDQS